MKPFVWRRFVVVAVVVILNSLFVVLKLLPFRPGAKKSSSHARKAGPCCLLDDLFKISSDRAPPLFFYGTLPGLLLKPRPNDRNYCLKPRPNDVATWPTQHVASNNVATCYVGMLRSFGRVFSFRVYLHIGGGGGEGTLASGLTLAGGQKIARVYKQNSTGMVTLQPGTTLNARLRLKGLETIKKLTRVGGLPHLELFTR